MYLGLAGKRAVVTGGSKGIGLATAMQLAAEGADVVIVARRPEPLEEAVRQIKEQTGRDIYGVAADVSVQTEVDRAVEEAAKRLGGIDILVNNAGTSAAQPFDEVTDDAWSHDIDLKLFAAIRFTRSLLPFMRQAGSGAIVNVTSVGGKTPSGRSMPSSVTRAAGLALTKAMSKDLAADGIRVNAVSIGTIRSEQIERMWQESAPELSWEDYSTDSRHGIPLGKIGEPDEAARVIAFLVSEAASYVTGTSVNIDGGKSAVM
ncbi:SDR family NAD(P)-dependent oxidoreductase [Paenibacillus daejeonensis]|uniref:SDR family NAD(P)-dependent oxidoreductase n=1 Tax=Paenibacillus daejeonensis TaxID=135193 RepID=UPI0003759D1E|nr:SDR family oxidoreductase [Paenibacillus daejeonensis]